MKEPKKPEDKEETAKKIDELKEIWHEEDVPSQYARAIVNKDSGEAMDIQAAQVRILNMLEHILKILSG